MHKFLFYNKFIIRLYMFRALLCSSSGGQNCVIQHLVSSHSVGGRLAHRLRESVAVRCAGLESPWPSGVQVERVRGHPVHSLREDSDAPDGHLQSVTIPDAV